MAWNRESLADKSIYYDEDIIGKGIPYAAYPPHVELLRNSVLDFSCSILSASGVGDSASKSPLEEAASSWGTPAVEQSVKDAYNAQIDALEITKRGYDEEKWAQLFRKSFFEPFENVISKSPGNTRSVSRCNYYYDGFRTAGSKESWRFFDGRKNQNDTSELSDWERERCPMPDYSCFLPIYHFDAETRIPSVHALGGRQWHQFLNQSIVHNFSWDLLAKLKPLGLESTPFKLFHNEPEDSKLRCYPWLIVEHKKEPDKSEYRVNETVHCQAANAAACAVQLNARTAKYALKQAESAHIPPIPVVTTVGPTVKVWIMYYAENFIATYDSWGGNHKRRKCNKGYIMRAIWVGEITAVKDAAAFRIILENIHTWAMREFRPLISSYIEAWKCVHLGQGGGTESALQRRQTIIDHYQTGMPQILDFLDDLDAGKLGSGAREEASPLVLGMLFQMIQRSERSALVGELTAVIDERMKGLARGPEAQTSTPENAENDEDKRNTPDTINAVDNEDPNDLDYVDSQPSESGSSQVNHLDSEEDLPARQVRHTIGLRSHVSAENSSDDVDTPRPRISLPKRNRVVTSIEQSTTSRVSLSTSPNNTNDPISSGPLREHISESLQDLQRSTASIRLSVTNEDTRTVISEAGREDRPIVASTAPSGSYFTGEGDTENRVKLGTPVRSITSSSATPSDLPTYSSISTRNFNQTHTSIFQFNQDPESNHRFLGPQTESHNKEACNFCRRELTGSPGREASKASAAIKVEVELDRENTGRIFW